CQQSVATPLNF
nr:immunoglobulin light chain junction region [Homo sapiens]